MRLRPKLSILFASVAAVAVGITSLVNYRIAESAIKDKVADQLTSLRYSKTQQIDTALKRVKAGLEDFSRDDATVAALRDFEKEVHNVPDARDKTRLASVTKTFFQGVSEQNWVPPTSSGQWLQENYGLGAVPGSLASMKVSQRYHQVLLRTDPPFAKFATSLGLSDLLLVGAESGQIIYSTRRGPELGNSIFLSPLGETNIARAVRESLRGKTSISDLEAFDAAHGSSVAFVTAPIKSGSKVVGVVCGQLNSDFFTKISTSERNWSREGLGETGEILLLGKDSTLRTESRTYLKSPRQFWDLMATLDYPSQVVKKFEARQTSVGYLPTNYEPGQLAMQGQDGTGVFLDYLGRKVVASYGPANILGMSWTAIAQQDVSEAYEPLKSLRNFSILTAICVPLFTILIAIAVSNSFTRPLERLASVAREFGAGQKGVRSNLQRKDEFGELGQAFDFMAEESDKLEEIAHQIRRNIVHDLKTPVTIIKGMAESLQEPSVKADEAVTSEFVGSIVSESDRLLDDLQDILQPVEAGYIPEVEEFDVCALVSSVVNAERHTGRAENHELTLDGADAPIEVIADRRKIRRVVENLISNAVKYSPGNGKTVATEIRVVGKRIAIHVVDQGLGLTPEQLKDLLGKGGRVEDHARLGIEGTGIGLGSVRHILQAHGGELRAQSWPGLGSRFTAIIPIRYQSKGH